MTFTPPTKISVYIIITFTGIIIVTDNNGHNSLCPYKNNQINVNCRGVLPVCVRSTHAQAGLLRPQPGRQPVGARCIVPMVNGKQ